MACISLALTKYKLVTWERLLDGLVETNSFIPLLPRDTDKLRMKNKMSFMGVGNRDLTGCWEMGQAESRVSCSRAKCPHERPTLKFTFRGTCGVTTRNELQGEAQSPPRPHAG